MDVPLSPSMIKGMSIVETWASGFHLRVNRLLRHANDVDDLYTRYPHAFFFTQTFIKYIYNHGVYKENLGLTHNTILYRGYKDYNIPRLIVDKGFIATSTHDTVSKRFAEGEDNQMIYFLVDKLPAKVPFLMIDERINRVYHENEVLMLPGIINVDLETRESSYTMNKEYIDDILSRETPCLTDSDAEIDGGGRRRKIKLNFRDRLPIDSAKGKRLVFYRAIQGRHVDVMGHIDCPTNDEKFRDIIRFRLPNMLNYYNGVTDYIPEVQDMLAYFKKPKKSEEKYNRLLKRWNSFFVHFAVVDTSNNQVLSICGFEPSCLFNEVFEQSRKQEVMVAVITYSTI